MLLWFLGCFVGIQLLSGWLLDRGVVAWRFPILKQHLDRLQSGPGPDVVFLGTSRMSSVIHDGEVTRLLRQRTGEPTLRAFNSAVPAGDLVTTELVVRELLAGGLRPRTVVLELVPEELQRTNPWTAVHIQRQLTWGDVREQLVPAARAGQLARLVSSRVLPVYAFRVPILRRFGLLPDEVNPPPEPHPDDRAGIDWTATLGAETSDPSAVAARTQAGIFGVQHDLRHYAIGGPARAALERTLRHLRAAGCAVVLLGVPLATAHRAQYTPAIEAAFQAHLRALRERFGVSYLDCRAALADADFLDHHHARVEGAIRFAAVVSRHLP